MFVFVFVFVFVFLILFVRIWQNVEATVSKAKQDADALVRHAIDLEEQASQLKLKARGMMHESYDKTERARRLDELAGSKEREVREMRGRVLANLESRRSALQDRASDAARSEQLDKRGAKTAQQEAEAEAAQSQLREKQAKKAKEVISPISFSLAPSPPSPFHIRDFPSLSCHKKSDFAVCLQRRRWTCCVPVNERTRQRPRRV